MSKHQAATATKHIHWIDQAGQLDEMCRYIVETAPENIFQGASPAAPKVVAVDLEGINLSRTGKICIVQVATLDESFLFDIATLKEEGIDSLRHHILENPLLLKVLFDCRQDVDALYYQYKKCHITPICDLQVGMVLKFLPADRRRFLIGMAKCFGEEKLRLFTQADMAIKEQVAGKTFDNKGGDPELWAKRPVDSALVAYAAVDVKYVFQAMCSLTPKQLEMSVAIGAKRRDATVASRFAVPRTADNDFAIWL
jgi:ribonuclease D